MARFHAPAVEPSEWMLSGVGSDHQFSGVQLRAIMAPDGVIDVGIVGSDDPDFRRLQDIRIDRRDFDSIPGYSSGMIVAYRDDLDQGEMVFVIDDRPTLAQTTVDDWFDAADLYLDRQGRPMSGQIEARCTADGIEVTATPDVDDQGAAAVLTRLARWRVGEAKEAEWRRQGWRGPGPGFLDPDTPYATMTLTIMDDGDGMGPGGFAAHGDTPGATQAELVAAIIVFIGRHFQEPRAAAPDFPDPNVRPG